MSIRLRGTKHLLAAAAVAMLGLAPVGAFAQTMTPVMSVPEPASIAIFGGALLALAVARRRRK